MALPHTAAPEPLAPDQELARALNRHQTKDVKAILRRLPETPRPHHSVALALTQVKRVPIPILNLLRPILTNAPTRLSPQLAGILFAYNPSWTAKNRALFNHVPPPMEGLESSALQTVLYNFQRYISTRNHAHSKPPIPLRQALPLIQRLAESWPLLQTIRAVSATIPQLSNDCIPVDHPLEVHATAFAWMLVAPKVSHCNLQEGSTQRKQLEDAHGRLTARLQCLLKEPAPFSRIQTAPAKDQAEANRTLLFALLEQASSWPKKDGRDLALLQQVWHGFVRSLQPKACAPTLSQVVNQVLKHHHFQLSITPLLDRTPLTSRHWQRALSQLNPESERPSATMRSKQRDAGLCSIALLRLYCEAQTSTRTDHKPALAPQAAAMVKSLVQNLFTRDYPLPPSEAAIAAYVRAGGPITDAIRSLPESVLQNILAAEPKNALATKAPEPDTEAMSYTLDLV